MNTVLIVGMDHQLPHLNNRRVSFAHDHPMHSLKVRAINLFWYNKIAFINLKFVLESWQTAYRFTWTGVGDHDSTILVTSNREGETFEKGKVTAWDWFSRIPHLRSQRFKYIGRSFIWFFSTPSTKSFRFNCKSRIFVWSKITSFPITKATGI